jgi:hypothetical protein
MKTPKNGMCHLAGLLAAVCAPAHATVKISSLTPSVNAPQVLGTAIVWTVTATDSNPGPLTFRFNVTPPGGSVTLARDYNVGTLSSGAWSPTSFAWTPTSIEGAYQIQVVAKDFTSGQVASLAASFQVTPLVSGSMPVAVRTANPLVALFSAPACPAGSSMRVAFQEQSLNRPATATNLVTCHPPTTMNFEIAGMYPTTAYNMFAQTVTGGRAVNGPVVSFTTGALPADIPFPAFKTVLAPGSGSDSAESVLLLSADQVNNNMTNRPSVASNLSGRILWYYYSSTADHFNLMTRPLPNGRFLTIQDDTAWNPASVYAQVLREVDLAGNTIHETNTGVIQQQLIALGAADAAACNSFTSLQVGDACLGAFHHEAIQTLPNGQTAVITDIEKIYPPGTQGDTSGLPVDIVGDMIVVLNSNWQVVWYFDTFDHAGGAPQLDITRPAVLGETCINNQPGCPPIFLLGNGIAPVAKDWLHANSLYYDPQDGSIIWSSRHQDWVMKIDYESGSPKATRNILWRMGPGGDFVMNNIYGDPWPWFSHQHDAAIQNNGLGSLTVLDNGNTRVAPPPAGLGSGNSRGMALTVTQNCSGTPPTCTNLQVTPSLSVDLGVYSVAMGSAELLSNNDYFFLAAIVAIPPTSLVGYSIEILPTAGTDTGTQVFNLEGPESYRAWRMPNLYQPPLI